MSAEELNLKAPVELSANEVVGSLYKIGCAAVALILIYGIVRYGYNKMSPSNNK